MTMKEFLFRELSTKKGLIFILAAFLAGMLVILQEARKTQFPELLTGFLGSEKKATLSIFPNKATHKTGEEFPVNIYLNTKGNKVVAVAVYLTYDPSHFQVVSVTTTDSVFGTGYEIINYNGSASHTPTGTIEIVKAYPSPGVKAGNGLVATIKFKALTPVSPTNDNITFTFTAPYASSDSDVILDDGQGTDILSGVNNAKYTLVLSKVYHLKVKALLEGKKRFNKKLMIRILDPESKEDRLTPFEETADEVGKIDKEIDVADLPSGKYQVLVKRQGYLAKKVVISWPTTTEAVMGKLSAGDLNDDNIINSLDWSVMSNKWRSSDVVADINEDGIVNTLDWGFLNKNWGKEGD